MRSCCSITVSYTHLDVYKRQDDFLANGEAAEGLCDLVRQAGATVVGIGICVEKSFQPGHQKLAQEGYHVVSLARVTAIRDGKLIVED